MTISIRETALYSTTRYMQVTYPWLVWFMGASFFFYKYLVQVSPSVMTTNLMQAFHINAAGLGNLSACYFYAYLLMQIPVGILLDKFSPRLLTGTAILLCALSTLVFAHAHSLILACVSRAIIGLCAAFAAVSCFKQASLWFSSKRFALVSGLCMTAAMLGAINGQVPLSFLVQTFNWRNALTIIAGIGVVLSLLYVLIIRDKTTPKQNELAILSHKGNLFSVLRNKQAWLLSLYSGFAFAPISVFGGLWGVPFLQEAHGLSSSQAALAVSYVFIGFAMGAPFWGWLSDAINRRKPVLFMGSLMALICLSITLYISFQGMKIISLLLFFFGFGASGFFTSFAMIREIFSALLAATVLGFMNTFDSICEAFSEPLIGAFLDKTWDGQIAHQVHQFSTHSYQLALTVLPLYLIFALSILFWIEETHCRPNNENSFSVRAN